MTTGIQLTDVDYSTVVVQGNEVCQGPSLYAIEVPR